MASKQSLNMVLEHVNSKLDKMVEEIKRAKSNLNFQLKRFEQVSFKGDEQYPEKK